MSESHETHYTVTAAAKFLGISKMSLYGLLKTGHALPDSIPPDPQTGQGWMIPCSNLVAYKEFTNIPFSSGMAKQIRFSGIKGRFCRLSPAGALYMLRTLKELDMSSVLLESAVITCGTLAINAAGRGSEFWQGHCRGSIITECGGG